MMAVGPDYVMFFVDQILGDVLFYRDLFAAIGICYVGKALLSFTWTICKGLKVHIAGILFKNDLRRFGKWAVVTGCTDGIGRAYCMQLAKQGINLALISRSMDKLNDMAAQIKSECSVEVICMEVDFNDGPQIYDRIAEFLSTIDTGILVNNVGVISPRPSYIAEMTETNIWEHIRVNVASVTIMTKLVLPTMLRKRQGAIVNVASFASFAPTPLLAVYSATKAYVNYFSRAVREEVQGSGIVVQTLVPSYVKTKMVGYNKHLMNSLMVPSPDIYAKSAIRTLGRSDYTTGYWLHGMQSWLISHVPLWIWLKCSGMLNKYFRRHYVDDRSQCVFCTFQKEVSKES